MGNDTANLNASYLFRVNKDVLRDVKKACRENGTTVSEFIRAAIDWCLKVKLHIPPQREEISVSV